ncbi:PadR family transcriptional regulator [Natronosporangium hydrolyticum]|uniref:PadR family transcriptional regulator n=1 Tax=Natronosporangium hydrolyticum TaxID=2811111 RepID=A0A895YHN2_9ACTN|nr:PadR family transcriptional regulator [Natronosporangium hydrolyticum]QSB15029.1 PadR family transcriptional regulator [Natronosporangium hydrolyticum]
MTKRRKVSNPLALAVLASLRERPMHPYELAMVNRERGKHNSMPIKWGSLYTVVENLEKHGYIQATETVREGRRPERTVYAITESGQAELVDWLRELLGVPEKEYPRLVTGLSLAGVLPPDEVVALLRSRMDALRTRIATDQEKLDEISVTVPRLFLIETEYELALLRAELTWLDSLIEEIEAGTLPGMPLWHAFHTEGITPTQALEQYQ